MTTWFLGYLIQFSVAGLDLERNSSQGNVCVCYEFMPFVRVGFTPEKSYEWR